MGGWWPWVGMGMGGKVAWSGAQLYGREYGYGWWPDAHGYEWYLP